MRIEFDYEYHPDGTVAGAHTVDTHDPAVWVTLRGMADGSIDHDRAGWSQISKHPAYAGLTRFEVLKAEVVRLDDPDGRSILEL